MVNALSDIAVSRTTMKIIADEFDLTPPTYEVATDASSDSDDSMVDALEQERSLAVDWLRHHPLRSIQPLDDRQTRRLIKSGAMYKRFNVGRWFKGDIYTITHKAPAITRWLVASQVDQPWTTLYLHVPMLTPVSSPRSQLRRHECAYFEVTIRKLDRGATHDEFGNPVPPAGVSIGTCTYPHPLFRPPGLGRLSSGLFSDGNLYFHDRHFAGETPRVFDTELREGDTIGCGVTWDGRVLFNLMRPDEAPYCCRIPAYTSDTATFSEPCDFDIYPAIGVQGAVQLQVNFGHEPFLWRAGAPVMNADKRWWRGTLDLEKLGYDKHSFAPTPETAYDIEF